MSEIVPLAALARLFDAVLCEARQNPAFHRMLSQALAGSPAHAPPEPTPAAQQADDVLQVHAINWLRAHGEAALRGRLEQIRAVEDLRRVARASGLVLTGEACKPRPSRAALIAGIVEAAKHYDAQRCAARA